MTMSNIFAISFSGRIVPTNIKDIGSDVVLAKRSNVLPVGTFTVVYRLYRNVNVLRRIDFVNVSVTKQITAVIDSFTASST